MNSDELLREKLAYDAWLDKIAEAREVRDENRCHFISSLEDLLEDELPFLEETGEDVDFAYIQIRELLDHYREKWNFTEGGR